MKVGDLVKCITVDGNPVGLVMSKHSGFLVVLVSGRQCACFQSKQLEVICKSEI